MKLVLINLLILAIGLSIVEIVFGSWLTPNRLNRLNLIRDVEYRYEVSDLYHKPDGQILYRRDAYGLRGDYGAPALIDIITMGGSTTDQRYITEGATWQDVIRGAFLSNGKNVNIANAGVDGQSTYGHMKSFDWWFPFIPNLRCRYILFYVGINDFVKDDNYSYDDLLNQRYTLYSYVNQQMQQRAALFHLYRTTRGMWQARVNNARHRRIDFQGVAWVDKPRRHNHEELMRTRLAAYVTRLNVLNSRTRILGARPIYVTQPSAHCKTLGGKLIGVTEITTYDGLNINGVDYCLMMELLNRRTIDFCRAVGGICVDLARELKFDDYDFYDYFHNTPKGAHKMGRYLHEQLKAEF